MKRNLLTTLTVGASYAALTTYLLFPTLVDAQSPPQGPPTATANAQSVLSNNLTAVLTDTIQPAIDAENAALVNNPNFHAVISVDPIISFSYMGQTTNYDQPNQFFADVPYSIIYFVKNISVQVGGTWVPYPDTAVIGQDLNIQTFCQGWFTGRGALTYTVVPSSAGYVGDTNFPNPQVGTLLQQVIPNFVNTTVKAKLAAYGSGPEGASIDSGAACRSLGALTITVFVGVPSPSSQPLTAAAPYIFFDPPAPTPPITTAQNTVTVTVTKIRRLQLDGANGLPAYETVENPILDFYAGFTHLHFGLPSMTEGQSFTPTVDNVATTLVPVESGTLVVQGVMTYEGLTFQDMAFQTFSRNLDYGAGAQTLDTPKQVLLRGVATAASSATTASLAVTASSLTAASLATAASSATTVSSATVPDAGYEITLEITAPPVSVVSAQ